MTFAGNDLIKRVVQQYSDMIIRIAFQHTKNMADAEDIAQDVFIVWLRQPLFSSEEHLKAWLIRVTVNKCKDFLKSAKKRKTVALDESQFALTKEQNEVIEQLQNLPEKDRNVLYLFYYERYSAKEIADIFGKKESAVFMSLNRARERLKVLLEDS